jgi:hypothetical protein
LPVRSCPTLPKPPSLNSMRGRSPSRRRNNPAAFPDTLASAQIQTEDSFLRHGRA